MNVDPHAHTEMLRAALTKQSERTAEDVRAALKAEWIERENELLRSIRDEETRELPLLERYANQVLNRSDDQEDFWLFDRKPIAKVVLRLDIPARRRWCQAARKLLRDDTKMGERFAFCFGDFREKNRIIAELLAREAKT